MVEFGNKPILERSADLRQYHCLGIKSLSPVEAEVACFLPQGLCTGEVDKPKVVHPSVLDKVIHYVSVIDEASDGGVTKEIITK